MIISDKSVVKLAVELHADDANGELVEQFTASEPLEILMGIGFFPPAAEQQLKGLKQGEAFEFILTGDDAYGEYDESLIYSFEKSTFIEDGQTQPNWMEVGNLVTFKDENEHSHEGMVMEVTEKDVVVDFNHPLSGVDLHFKGEVLSVREATAEEISHGHVHQEGHHHH